MRTFEVVLILVNFLSLFLSFKKLSKAFWLGAAGVNLSVFFIHGIVEGFQYQMFFPYIFKGKLNLDKIGAIGHSLGGAVAHWPFHKEPSTARANRYRWKNRAGKMP